MAKGEVDISNQIDNSWVKDTALALVQGSLKYSIKIEVNNKSTIKKLCEYNTKHEAKYKEQKNIQRKTKRYFNRVVSLTHAYLLYRLIMDNRTAINSITVCKDSIAKFLHNYLQNITQNKNKNYLVKHIKIKYGLKKKNNSAQDYAKSVAKGEIPASYTLNKKDVEEIIILVEKFIPKN